jgi:hypothetical protein
LKQPDARDRVAELRDIIRDIRSDEANVYRELRSICAICQDYDAKSELWREFYRRTQAKLIFAVASHTPAEVIHSRANADADFMGLQSWNGDALRKSDVTVSKNYLGPSEVRELNRLTTIVLDIFEDQLDLGRLTMMAQAEVLLDNQLQSLGRALLRGGGQVSTAQARDHAESEYDRYKQSLKVTRHAEADEAIAAIKLAAKSLPKGRSS